MQAVLEAEIPRIQTEFVGYFGCRFYVSNSMHGGTAGQGILVFRPSKVDDSSRDVH